MSSHQHTARLPYHKLSSKAFMGLVGVSETIKKGPLGTRLAELVRLTLDGGDSCLDWGAVATGPRRGLAWVEMARGLLVHWLCVDAQGRVERYGVLAPTEWNFHPQGAAAQVLRALDAKQPAPQLAAAAAVLVAAFDPCVDYELAPARDDAEVACA